jgi:acetolactate synthase-1/2/3 large subunit
MRVVDYIAQRLARETDTVFVLAGGGARFLNDAFSWNEGLTPVFCHHEQTCAMAAEAYARFSGKLGLANVTTGPGGINALNGVFGAWTDSLPMIVVSGQVKRQTTLRATGQLGKLRQLGDQEVDIVSLVRPITKMASFVSEIDEVPFILEESIHAARDGRPGPVWIDVPSDIQSAELDPAKYFLCNRRRSQPDPEALAQAAAHVAGLIGKAKKPLLLIGSAARASGALPRLMDLAHRLGIPVSASWTAVDAIDHRDPSFAERPGVVGTRAGNIIAQQADLIVVLGSRLPIRQVSYNWENFARSAVKVGVDIDPAELAKPFVDLDVMINAEVGAFVAALAAACESVSGDWSGWIQRVRSVRDELPPIDHRIRDSGHPDGALNPYLFVEDLWRMLRDDEIVACADASASVIPLQVAPIRAGQRLFTNAGSASMGYELPAAIGAAFANRGKRIICMAGDGSLMLNIQELETVQRYGLPIKIVLLNNKGYLSIKLSQSGFFGRQKGSGPESGLGFPNFEWLAKANSLPYQAIRGTEDYPRLREALDAPGAVIIDVSIDPAQAFEPKLGSYRLPDGSIESNSLENMSPLLDADYLRSLMGD